MGLLDRLRGRRPSLADREAAVRRAALEAAQDDPAFAPERVEARARALYLGVQRAWSADDLGALRGLVGPELLVEWEARLADYRRRGWRNLVEVLDGPEVRYVGLTNRAGTGEDRVVVRVAARLRDVAVDRSGRVMVTDEGEVARIAEFWTLAPGRGSWQVVSVEQEREGAHQLRAPLVAAPEGDDARLRADAVMELAAADGVAAGAVGELLSPAFSGPARAAALDLSLVDGRFAPDVLATAVGEVVEAWAEAVDGPDARLAARTTPEALDALLHPTGARERMVIRGLEVRGTTIVAVQGGAAPEVALELEVSAVQYVEDRETAAVRAGDPRRRTRTRQRWRLRLRDDPRRPWVVVAATGVVPG